MRRILIFLIFIILALASACADDIDFDYSTVEPMSPVEGHVGGGVRSPGVSLGGLACEASDTAGAAIADCEKWPCRKTESDGRDA